MNLKLFLKTIFFLLLVLNIETNVFGYTAADYTSAGLQVYAKKDYILALRYFAAALALEPANTRALQGRANCNYYLGRYQQALGDYEKLLAQNPSGSLSQFVQALRAKIGTSTSAAAPPGISPRATATPVKSAGIGLRVEPAFMMINLVDFNADAQTRKAEAPQLQATDPAPPYKYDASVPTAFVGAALEPVAKLGGGFEIGLPFAFLPVGKASSTGQDAGGYNDATSYDISAFSVGLDLRCVIGSGPIRPFISAEGLMIPIGVSYTEITNYPPNPTQSLSGNFSGTAFGGQGQLGLDIHIGDFFVVSLFGGYQQASANSFNGNVTNSGTGTTTSSSGDIEVVPTSNGNKVAVVSGGNLVTGLFDGNQTLPAGSSVPAGARPLQIDLSGVLAGIHLSFYF